LRDSAFTQLRGQRIKRKVKKGSRSRTKQHAPKNITYMMDFDDGTRLTLSKQHDHPLFPRQWVLSHDDLILQVTRKFPEEVWENLTRDQKEKNHSYFKPIPIPEQDLRRRIENEEYRRIMFWDRVQKHGVKKHSPLKLWDDDETDLRDVRIIVKAGNMTPVPIEKEAPNE